MARKFLSVRWDMDNCDFLCRACHQFFTDNPASFWKWLSEVQKVDVEALERRAQVRWDGDYGKVIQRLEAQLGVGDDGSTERSSEAGDSDSP